MTKYYYYENDEKISVTGKELQELAKTGKITPETLIKNEAGKTSLAGKVKGLSFPETAAMSVTTLSDSAIIEITHESSIIANPFSATASVEQGENFTEPESASDPIQDIAEPPDASEFPTDNETSTSESTPDIADRVLSELKPLFTALNEKVESLTKEVDFWKQLVEKKQEQIDKLYDENLVYKDSVIEQFKKKLVLGVIEQLDTANKQILAFESREESEKNYANLLLSFREIIVDFLDMLRNRLGITPFHSNHGEKFDPTRHNALRREPTGDRDKDTSINRTMRYGYANNDGSILRQEMVEVLYYDASLPAPQPTAGTTDPTEDQEEKPLATPPVSEESRADEQDNSAM